jgi:hypothetical protein
MRFDQTNDGLQPLNGVLRFIENEHAFGFDVAEPVDLAERAGPSGVTSLAVGTLQVEVGVATGLVLFVWGLHPRTHWKVEPVGAPRTRLGAVRVADAKLRRGISLQVAEVGAWMTSFDPETEWVRVAEPGRDARETVTVVATDTGLGVHDGSLTSIWLRPVIE